MESYWRNNEKVKLDFEVSEMFYLFLEECAENYCISVDDYIKLLIEQNFAHIKEWKIKNTHSLDRE